MSAAGSHGLSPVREVLPNGAVVLVKETATTPSVTINAAFRAGSIYDPENLVGLAHYLSRVIDRGTKDRSADDIAEELDTRGIALQITTNRHILSLSCTCLSEDFESLLGLLADIMRRPSFPEDEIDIRRSEIVTALRQDQDNPAVRAVEALLELLYPKGHPYGRRAKGTLDSVARVDRAALTAFHQARFAPDALSLVIVGDVRPGAAVAAAQKAFGNWNASAAPETSLAPPPRRMGRDRIVYPMMNKAQADIAYGFTAVTRFDPAYYSYWIMNNVFGQYGLGGRLGDSIRERQGMAYYAFSSFDANVAEGPLLIRAGVNPANVDRAVASIDEEVQRMAREGITDRELADAKQYLIGSIPRTLETNASIATVLQTIEFFQLGLDYVLRLPSLLRAVTRDEVNAAARATFSPEQAAIVIAGPYEGAGEAEVSASQETATPLP